MAHGSGPATAGSGFLGFSPYHWLVIGAAWAGWGFDMFDALLFNFVAPNCLPVLLGLQRGSAQAQHATVFWTGAISSLLLVGWAAGGILFGWVGDRIGRQRALFATILVYAVGTALCALATNIWELIAFRVISSLGIGGEWGIGAALVAESVPENRRVQAGVILQTSSPVGIGLASAVNYLIAGVWMTSRPDLSWRFVFLAGLVPVLLALLVRVFVRESSHWTREAARARPPSPVELFGAGLRRRTLSGIALAASAVIAWWGCNAFIPLLGSTLAAESAAGAGLSADFTQQLAESWKAFAATAFNVGGFAGALAALVLGKLLSRRRMYFAYFMFSALALFAAFGLDLAPLVRMSMLLLVGAGVFGVFGTFPFYLPELFPSRLRASGAGLCYNIGRLIAAAGPLIVGAISAHAGGSSAVICQTLLWVGVIPLVTAIATPFIVTETRNQPLQQ